MLLWNKIKSTIRFKHKENVFETKVIQANHYINKGNATLFPRSTIITNLLPLNYDKSIIFHQ